MIHVYYGDGKGKTTAAIGLAVRAAGCGKRVLICRFLKNSDSGELAVLEGVGNITLFDCGETEGLFCRMCADKRESTAAKQRDAFLRVCGEISHGGYGTVILDEVLWLCTLGIIDDAELCRLADGVGADCELVLTGGSASDKLLASADYVTRMAKISHPYDRGEAARAGVEF